MAEEAQTVRVRVQVVDVESSRLELVLPLFLRAGDLAKRIAADAGLGTHWEGGVRRTYTLRGRGRLLEPDESLASIGVVNGELLHLLPEPPEGAQVVERPIRAERSEEEGGDLWLALSFVAILLWTTAWGVALTAGDSVAVKVLGGLPAGMLAASASLQLLGGAGRSPKILGAAVGVCLLLYPLALVPGIWLGLSVGDLATSNVAGGAAMVLGAVIGWIARWEAVEPLPEGVVAAKGEEAQVQGVAAPICGLCGGEIERAYLHTCPYGCDKTFHTGCFQARMAVGGDPSSCNVCGAALA